MHYANVSFCTTDIIMRQKLDVHGFVVHEDRIIMTVVYACIHIRYTFDTASNMTFTSVLLTQSIRIMSHKIA